MPPRTSSTIDKILLAAENLFLEKSYAEVTLDLITRAALITKGGLYHHFASKEELYLTMMCADLDKKKHLLSEAIKKPGSCREQLQRLTANFFALPVEKQKLIRLIRRDANIFTDPIRTRLIKAYQDALPNLIEQVLREAVARGEVVDRDPRLMAWQFVAMVEVTLGDNASNLLSDVPAKLEFLLDLFFHGVSNHLPPEVM